MKEIKTNAFFHDEEKNLYLMFGNDYIGVEAGKVKDEDVHYLKFEELQKPWHNDISKKEDYKPRTDIQKILLLFPNIESIDVVINALQEIRKRL